MIYNVQYIIYTNIQNTILSRNMHGSLNSALFAPLTILTHHVLAHTTNHVTDALPPMITSRVVIIIAHTKKKIMSPMHSLL